jgi:hypothetical protein
MKRPSGRGKKGESASALLINDLLLTTELHHHSSMMSLAETRTGVQASRLCSKRMEELEEIKQGEAARGVFRHDVAHGGAISQSERDQTSAFFAV